MIALPWVGIDILLVVLWTIAAALAIALIMDKLAAVLDGVPGIGGWLASHVRGMAQAITNGCGQLMHGIEGLVGSGLHLLARYFDTLFSQFVAHASVVAHLAQIVGNQIYSVSGLRSLVHGLTRSFHGIEHGIRTLVRAWHGIEHRVRRLEHELARGIGHDLRITVKALERELHTAETKTLPAIESDVRTVAGDVTALGEYVRANFLSSAKTAIAAAVAVGLAALGLGGLRCSTLTNSLANRGCGLWKDLEGLLGLFADTLLLTNVCELIPLLEAGISEVADPLVVALTDVGAGLCSGGIGPAPALPVPALSLPSSPGFTLNLP